MKQTSRTSLVEREAAAERVVKIFELYKRGSTFKECGAPFDMTASGARKAILRVLRGVETHDARQQRNLMLERYQSMRREVWRVLDDPNTTIEQKMAALDRGLRIENQTAEILGLKKMVVKITDETDTSIPINAAREILARAATANRFLEAKRVGPDVDDEGSNGNGSNGSSHGIAH